MRDYVHRYCREGSQPSKDGKIIIRDVTDRSFRTILFTFGSMASGVCHTESVKGADTTDLPRSLRHSNDKQDKKE